jgi:hypothetical protein
MRILSVLIIYLTFQSCTIEKRLYSNGFNINSYFFKKNFNKIDNVSFKRNITDSASLQSSPESDLTSSISTEFKFNTKHKFVDQNEIPTLQYQTPNQPIKKTNKVEKKESNNHVKSLIINLNYSKNEINIKKQTKEKITWDDVFSFLGWLAGMIVILGIMFLIGFGLHALFPRLSILASALLSIPTFFILLLLFYVIASIISPHV